MRQVNITGSFGHAPNTGVSNNRPLAKGVCAAETAAAPVKTEDRFERTPPDSPIGYEKFSLYREISDSLDKIRDMDVPSDGVPSPLLIKSTLEAIQQTAAYTADDTVPTSADPYILTRLLDELLRHAAQ